MAGLGKRQNLIDGTSVCELAAGPSFARRAWELVVECSLDRTLPVKPIGVDNLFGHKDLQKRTARFSYRLGRLRIMFFKNQRIGKYKILETIGSGGFGSVYLAKDVWIDKRVAIKVPHKQGENVEKLLQEPRILASLNHPNIVQVLTAERVNDIFFIVMEYVDGTSLEAYLRQHRKLELDLAMKWFGDIGRAIGYAHSKNILHRDIRPANVLISAGGGIKLADLGTSRYLVEDHFASTRIGSPPYMAPEHFQGKATFQSDIYSFGVLMYECLTGRLPFFDRDPVKLAKLAREGEYPMPHQHEAAIPLELSRIVSKSMHRALSSRYQDMAALQADLDEIQLPVSLTLAGSPPARVAERPQPTRKPFTRAKGFSSRELSDLFCWNCSKPVQRRTRTCPHCNVSLR